MQMKLPRQNGKVKPKKAVQLLMARAAVSSSRLMAVVYLPRTNNIFPFIYLFKHDNVYFDSTGQHGLMVTFWFGES